MTTTVAQLRQALDMELNGERVFPDNAVVVLQGRDHAFVEAIAITIEPAFEHRDDLGDFSYYEYYGEDAKLDVTDVQVKVVLVR